MPKQLVVVRVPLDQSIFSFSIDEGEELFLTYTWERAEGPDIRRTGIGPPYMALIGGQPGQITTHAFGLRLGTWLICERMRNAEIEVAQEELNAARRTNIPEDADALEKTTKVLEQTIKDLNPNELRRVQSHDEVFMQHYNNYDIVGQQGCGDLTMNSWKVAYVNNKLAPNPPTLVCLPQEPLDSRTYTCLIKWKGSGDNRSSLSIQEARFNRRSNIRDLNEMVWVRDEDRWYPRGEIIEFAVSSPQVIRDGQIVPVATICNQFGDLRHLIHMPNLNPEDKPILEGEQPKSRIPDPNEPGKLKPIYRPRQYFNRAQFQDVWLGEEAFLRDETQNLLRTALSYPIFLDFPPDANKAILRGVMGNEGYREVSNNQDVLERGTWRFVDRSPQVTVLEVFFKRNTYGYSMIGLSPDEHQIFFMACTGKAGKSGLSVEDAAAELLKRGARNALLIDEGDDVFQIVRWQNNEPEEMVPQKRRRLRATFIVAKQKHETNDG